MTAAVFEMPSVRASCVALSTTTGLAICKAVSRSTIGFNVLNIHSTDRNSNAEPKQACRKHDKLPDTKVADQSMP